MGAKKLPERRGRIECRAGLIQLQQNTCECSRRHGSGPLVSRSGNRDELDGAAVRA